MPAEPPARLSVRPVIASDADACSTVMCASIAELCGLDHDGDAAVIRRWTANKGPETVKGWLADPRIAMVIAERAGAAVGVGAVSESGEVLLVYVLPGARFSGVSKAVLAQLEAIMAERGVTVGRLVSTKTAHRFYRSRGWQDAGRPKTRFGMTGFPMHKVLT